MRSIIKFSDLIGGAVAMFVALLYVTPQSLLAGERLMLIAAALVGLVIGWHVTRERHWIVKIFLYVGMMLISILVVNLIARALFYE